MNANANMKSKVSNRELSSSSSSSSGTNTQQRPSALTFGSFPTAQTFVTYDLEHIRATPSPVENRPVLFRSGMLFDRNADARTQSITEQIADVNRQDTSENLGSFNVNSDGMTIEQILEQDRQNEINRLAQATLLNRPDDESATIIMNNLNIAASPVDVVSDNHNDISQSESEISVTTMASRRSYPPINQVGVIEEHDRPYADYGHLDRRTIARECQFDLQIDNRATPIRLNAKSLAITSWTDVPKETVLDHIKRKFGIEHIQYICICEEISEFNHRRHIHIQIILKEKVNLKSRFLDALTLTSCNYQVTQNDVAWNEYIKKNSDYIEFGEFLSTRARGRRRWPSPSPTNQTTSSENSLPSTQRQVSTSRTNGNRTVRIETEERRRFERETAETALKLAEKSIDRAMDLIRQTMPTKFLAHSSWYLGTFKYVMLRAQQEAERHSTIQKDYVWPTSFPECTPQLREAMNRWIRHHFSRTSRAKCLIIIGPTGTGKTCFALSLPGRVNYFQERWNLDKWSDYARYSVYDDIPWDKFTDLNYPAKKALLTQNGKINATDKYRSTKEIKVQQPAIVLLNPEDAGSLLAEPRTRAEIQTAEYWKQRSFVYVMNPGEYFYRKPTSDEHQQNGSSGSSSMASNEPRMGQPEEFQTMINEYQQHRATRANPQQTL